MVQLPPKIFRLGKLGGGREESSLKIIYKLFGDEECGQANNYFFCQDNK